MSLNLNINKFLNYKPSDIMQTNCYCIISSFDDYILVDYITEFINNSIKSIICDTKNLTNANINADYNYTNYNYIIDKNYDIESNLSSLLCEQSLFETTNLIKLSFNTPITKIQYQTLSAILPLINKNNFLIMIINYKTTKKELEELQKLLNITNNNINTINLNINYDSNAIISIINNKFKQYNCSLDQEAIKILLELNNNNNTELMHTVDKIINTLILNNNYKSNNTNPNIINKEQVTKLLFNNNKYNIYMLSHAYLSGNLEQAIIIFNQIYNGVEDAILISWIILEDVRKLLKIKNAIKNNITLHNIFYELKIIKDNIQAFTLANSRISYNQILDLYQDLSIIDLAIKGLMPNLNIHTKFLEIISKISFNTNIFPDK